MNYDIQKTLSIELDYISDTSSILKLLDQTDVIVDYVDEFELRCEYKAEIIDILSKYKFIDIISKKKLLDVVMRNRKLTHINICASRV